MTDNVIPFTRPAKAHPEPPPILIGPAEALMLLGVGFFAGLCVALMLGRL